MKFLVFTILTLVISSATATPYDGVYLTREYDALDQIAQLNERMRRGVLTDYAIMPQSTNTYLSISANTKLSIEEQENGSIVLLKRNLNKNDFQVYVGYEEVNGYRFVNVFNQTEGLFVSDDGVNIESEEIYIKFDDAGNGTYSHTLIVSGEFFYTGVAVPDDGRSEILVAEPIYKIGTIN